MVSVMAVEHFLKLEKVWTTNENFKIMRVGKTGWGKVVKCGGNRTVSVKYLILHFPYLTP
jgi:hypothetical protein